MRKISRSTVLIAIGIIFLCLSAFLEIRLIYADKISEENARQIVSDMKSVVSDSGDNLQTAVSETDYESDSDYVSVDGGKYYGILSIPTIDVELPVSYDYSYEQMSESLCRYYGSIESRNLIICGHNNASFLQNLDSVNEGDSIILTDSSGERHEYVVNEIQLIGGYEMRKLKEDGTDWDLSVFTCNYSGLSRYVLRCKMK